MSWGLNPWGSAPWGAAVGVDLSVDSPVTQLLSGELDRVEDLLWVRPYSAFLGARMDLYLGDGWASKPGATLPTGEPLPNQYFLEVLDKAPNREVHVLESGEISTSAVPSYGAAVISDPYKEFLASWRQLSWDGAPAVHYQGSPNWDLSSFGTVFRGEVSRFAPTGGVTASIQLRDIIQKLQQPVETEVYLGFGPCLKGDGINGRLAFGDVLDRTGSFTFRCRIWPDSGTNASSRLWNKDDGATGWLSFLSNRNIAWLVRGGATVTTAGNPLTVAVWNDVWIVYDAAAQTLTFYVIHDDSDDILAETFAYTTSPTGNAHSLTFGAASGGATAFAGRWDELAVFSRALTLAEITSYRHRELLDDADAAETILHCNEATLTTAFDSVSSNDGTLTGGVAWAGSLTGTKGVAGKVRLGGAGIVLEREPVLVDEVDNVYEVAKGGMVGVLQDAAGYLLKDRGIRPYIYDGNFASPYAATPAVGHWMSINASGLIRLGNRPDGRLTVTAQITADTSAGGVIAFLAAKALDGTEIDSGALALLTSANPAPVSIPWGLESSTIDSHIVTAAKSVGAWRTVSLGGLLTAQRLEVPVIPTVNLYGNGTLDDDIEIDGISEIHTASVPRFVEVRYAPYETTQTATDLSSTLTPREREDLSLPFRSLRTPDSAAALAANAAALPVILETRLVYEADARIEAERQAVLRNAPQRTDSVALTKPRHDLQPGTVVGITADTVDYGLGRIMVVVGKVIDDARRQHTLEVWGFDPPIALAVDGGEVLVTDSEEILTV